MHDIYIAFSKFERNWNDPQPKGEAALAREDAFYAQYSHWSPGIFARLRRLFRR